MGMRWFPRLRAGMAAVVVAAVTAMPAPAQQLAVRVVDPASGPVAGVMVGLLAADSTALDRRITDGFGSAKLRGPAGVHRVLVQRPGLADQLSPAPALGSGRVDTLTIEITAVPTRLPTVLVRSPERCTAEASGVPDGIRTAWHEALKTLTIAALTEDLHLADLSITSMRRRLSASLDPLGETMTTLLLPANRPAQASLPAARAGAEVLIRAGDSLAWAAPDIGTFGDPLFAEGHCFGLVNGSGPRVGQIGVTFDPVAAPGIRLSGTFWLSASRRHLELVEYRLTGLPRSWRPERSGGVIEIHRMVPGFWITRFWLHRVPVVDQARDRALGFLEYRGEVTALIPTVDTTDRTAAARAIVQREAETRARVARMEGVVVDTLGYPIPDAEVSVLGTEHTATSRGDGRFALDGLPLGLQIVRARKIGYKPVYFGLRLAGGQTWDGRIGLEREPQVLGDIVVVGRYGKPARYANTSKYDEFYRRRATASGRFLTRDDIDRSAAGRISDLLRAIPGIRVSFGAPGMGEEVSFLNCPSSNVSVWIDGQRLTGLVGELLPLIAPQDVEAIEVYQRQSIIPAAFRDNACGAIVMWTR